MLCSSPSLHSLASVLLLTHCKHASCTFHAVDFSLPKYLVMVSQCRLQAFQAQILPHKDVSVEYFDVHSQSALWLMCRRLHQHFSTAGVILWGSEVSGKPYVCVRTYMCIWQINPSRAAALMMQCAEDGAEAFKFNEMDEGCVQPDFSAVLLCRGLNFTLKMTASA